MNDSYIYHILTVEDSPTQALRLQNILEGAGFAVDVKNDGQSAIAYLDENTPDLVISDIVMPVLTGYDLCRHIKLRSRASPGPFKTFPFTRI